MSVWLLLAMCIGITSPSPVTLNVEKVVLATFQGPVGPVTAEYVGKAINYAVEGGAQMVILQLDTPGGLDTAMRETIKYIENSPVPVVVYVAPPGARAASAGAFITLASHIAAMAPGTNIGAAHPVNMGGEKISEEMLKKVENDAAAYAISLAKKHKRNVEWAEKAVRKSISTDAEKAREIGVVEIVASDINDLLKELNGRIVSIQGVEKKLVVDPSRVTLDRYEMSFRLRFLKALSNPNLAYVLMMIGFWGIFFELSNPGAIFPGVIGAISLILAFVAFQTLPVNYAGIFLIILGIIFFIAEIKITSYGLLGIAGAISMFIGSIMLFEGGAPYYRISYRVLLPTFFVTLGFIVLAVALAVKAQLKKPALGFEGIEGEEGEVVLVHNHRNVKIFVHGEYWDAISDEPLTKGDRIVVTGRKGMKLLIKKVREV